MKKVTAFCFVDDSYEDDLMDALQHWMEEFYGNYKLPGKTIEWFTESVEVEE